MRPEEARKGSQVPVAAPVAVSAARQGFLLPSLRAFNIHRKGVGGRVRWCMIPSFQFNGASVCSPCFIHYRSEEKGGTSTQSVGSHGTATNRKWTAAKTLCRMDSSSFCEFLCLGPIGQHQYPQHKNPTRKACGMCVTSLPLPVTVNRTISEYLWDSL